MSTSLSTMITVAMAIDPVSHATAIVTSQGNVQVIAHDITTYIYNCEASGPCGQHQPSVAWFKGLLYFVCSDGQLRRWKSHEVQDNAPNVPNVAAVAGGSDQLIVITHGGNISTRSEPRAIPTLQLPAGTPHALAQGNNIIAVATDVGIWKYARRQWHVVDARDACGVAITSDGIVVARTDGVWLHPHDQPRARHQLSPHPTRAVTAHEDRIYVASPQGVTELPTYRVPRPPRIQSRHGDRRYRGRQRGWLPSLSLVWRGRHVWRSAYRSYQWQVVVWLRWNLEATRPRTVREIL